MRRRHRSAALLAVLAVAAAGCRTTVPHVRPELPTAPAYPAELAPDPAAGIPAPEIGWRELFADPRLEALLDAALERNRDLVAAVARVEEARGLFRIVDADRLPTVDAAASASRTRLPESEGGETFDRFAIGVRVPGFELDFWGRVRNLSDAARARYLATVEGARAFRLLLVRDVAAAYLASLEAAQRIELAEATVESRREGLRIAGVRFEAGITSALDFRQAESLLTQAEAELAALRLAKAERDNLLAVLVGGPVPGELPPSRPLTEQIEAGALAPGLPSDLLLARPDVLAAEERLRAARADVGAARAAFFPRIALTGDLGFASAELSDLVGSDGLTWSFGPSITLPIFNRGRLHGDLTVAEAREVIAVADYEITVQLAFQEVANALAGRRYLAEQVDALLRGVEAQRAIAELARTRYREGVVRYLEVLDAERNLFAAEQALLQLRRAEVENLVALYVALGGGLAADGEGEEAAEPEVAGD
ncbi:MAG TPA: efflux transporter outer membrane subunit [Thermoanaerobaculia bacterium]|nr:efflux transporter outer membrane subunit [Thermoanaerobaculia bacterium]